MIALRTIWRWTPNTHPNAPIESDSFIETIQPGERCDWVTPDSPYVQLGWVVPAN